MIRLHNHILIPKVAEMVKKGHTVTLPLRGYSMRPFLEDERDRALLTSVPLYLHVGDVVVAEVSPKVYAMHRIVRIEGDIITMYGDGNFSPEYVERQDIRALAIGFYRKGSDKLVSVDSLGYKLYWKTWVALRPIRRYLLLLWKLKHYPKKTLVAIGMKLTGRKTNSKTI